MGRDKKKWRAYKRTSEGYQSKPTPQQPSLDQDPKSGPIKWWDRIWDKPWKVVVGISVIITIITGVISINNDWFKSAKKKADEENMYQDTLKPPPITPSPTYKPTATSVEDRIIFLHDSVSYYVKHPDTTKPKILGINLKDALSK